MPQTYEYLDKMQERINRFVTEHSDCSEEKLRELMFTTGSLARDVGSVVVGSDAVAFGLIGAVGGLREALEKLNALVLERRERPAHEQQAPAGQRQENGRQAAALVPTQPASPRGGRPTPVRGPGVPAPPDAVRPGEWGGGQPNGLLYGLQPPPHHPDQPQPDPTGYMP